MKHPTVTRLLLPVSLLVASIVPTLALAQLSSNVSVFATGLQNPRGLKFGPDGLLYVAEAGTAGTASTVGTCLQVPSPVGPYRNGNTSRISRIDAQGNRTTVASGFPSGANSQTPPAIVGVADLAFLKGELYAVNTGGGCSHGNAAIPNGIVKVDLNSGTWKTTADLSSFVLAHPTKYPDPADFDPDGVFYSMIADRDRLYTVEANHGQILSIDGNGNIRREIDTSASEGHIVPTALSERDGLFYLGDLNTFPIVVNSARTIILSHDEGFHNFAPGLDPYDGCWWQLKTIGSKAGFTTIVSNVFGPDGLLYILELSAGAGSPGLGAGKVVRVSDSGEIEDVATGLSLPTGTTFGPDGKLYISNLGSSAPGDGQIVRITVN